MRSHQQRFLADVEEIAKDMGMVMTHDPEQSNRGSVAIGFEDSYVPVVSFGYDFQTHFQEGTRASFEGLRNPSKPDVEPTPGHYDPRDKWLLKSNELDQILREIRQVAARALNERRAAEIAAMDGDAELR